MDDPPADGMFAIGDGPFTQPTSSTPAARPATGDTYRSWGASPGRTTR
ncbi:MAG: hypothetical protein WBO46_19765 [Caldilineaceae bacterium]